MADESKYMFKKGHINGSSKNPYQEPTYLTFSLMFDMTSPLFNKDVAARSLREQYGEADKAAKLEQFIDSLVLINKEMPWYFTGIEGVDRVFDLDMKKPYWGGNEAKLTISCNESINLPISGLMDLYREAMYNFKGWTQTLPGNYKRFNLYVVVSEIRTFQVTNAKGEAINTNISADFKPHFMFKFGACKFDITSGKEVFEGLKSDAPEFASPKIRIMYETVEKISAKYLNDMIGINIDSNTNATGIGLEDRLPNTYAQRAGQALNDAMNTAMGGIRNFNPINELKRPNNVYGSVFDQAFERAVNQIDAVAGGVSRIPENLFADATKATTSETQNIIKSAKENIFGIESGSTLGAALRQGSINSILPMINNIGNRQNLGNVNKG